MPDDLPCGRMDPIRISVVTIALNAARDLPLTIESVLAQDYPHIEAVVIDGCSWDGSHDVLERYRPHVDRLIVREDGGIYPAMNAALDDVTGDYVIFLNAGDQFFSADAVSRIVAGLVGRPAIFYGKHIYVGGGRETLQRAAAFGWIMRVLRAGTIDHAWHTAIPGHQATFTDAALLRRLRYDTRLLVSADHDLLFRAYAAGEELQYVDEIVAHYHGGGFSATAGEVTRIENASIYRRFSDRPADVDRYFYPHGSPFGPETARTGFWLTGLIPAAEIPGVRAEEEGARWVSGDACVVMTPQQPCDGMLLAGVNRFSEQSIAVVQTGVEPEAAMGQQGIVLAEMPLPRGPFHVELIFPAPVAPGTMLTVRARRCHEAAPGRAVAFAMKEVEFVTGVSAGRRDLSAGDTVAFRTASLPQIALMLGTGWCQPEDTHVWSIGPRAAMRLSLGDDVRTLLVEAGGNPHVAGGRQTVEIFVNDIAVDRVVFDHGERRVIALELSNAAWRAGRVNRLLFVLDRHDPPPAEHGDTRELGICLWSASAE